MSKPQVILLPGAVLPKDLAYGALLDAIGDRADARPKDLEVYAGDAPPESYSLDLEVEGVMRHADATGFDRVHLVGYSAGGAVAAACAAAEGDRVLSLSLLEPAWLGNQGISEQEAAARAEIERIAGLPAPEMMAAFVRSQLAPGVDAPEPPPGPPPDWMRLRPAGIIAIMGAFDAGDIDPDALRSFTRPVYYALGALSNPDLYGQQADRAATLFADFTLEVFEERHHFDPPHRIEPERLAESLLHLWGRAA